MKRAFLCGIVLACIGAVAPAPQGLIAPPPGWVRENLPAKDVKRGTAIAQWLSFDRGDEEYVEVGYRRSFGLSTAGFARYISAYARRDGTRFFADHAVRLCNGESGWTMEIQSTLYPHAPREERVFLADGSRVYYALYTYPAKFPPLPKARASIASLCLRGRVVSNDLPAPPVKFVAPPGWLRSNPATFGAPVMPGTIGLFLDPSGSDTIWLVREPGPGDAGASDDADMQRAQNAEKAHVTSYEQQTMELKQLCGHTAAFFGFRAVYGDQRIDAESMLLLGPTLYLANYQRKAGSPENPSARAALETLCPPATDGAPPSDTTEQVPVSVPNPASSASPTVIQPIPPTPRARSRRA
ncbi:MAG TPA: hypothetical protein VMV65_09975 [Alphaproteobacteria bacterium]|nr:hypothetical protein [Alphaproteobacteria bacterium]